MEEENREQPQAQAQVSSETGEVNLILDAGCDEGSQTVRQAQPEREYGKFKSAEDLLTAYNNLEAEFTKKCQRLSQLEKERTSAPSVNIEEGLEKFLSQNEEAKLFSEEIKTYVQEQLHNAKSPFEVAWARVVCDHVSKAGADDPILNKVLSSDSVQNRVVENYLNALKEQKTPVVLSSQKGQKVSSVEPDTPKTLQEAKSLVEKMFS